MKQIIPFLILSVLLPSIARAEMRSIAIEVSGTGSNITRVSIHSAVENEIQTNISVAEAASILKAATGRSSSVMVVIVTDGTTDIALEHLIAAQGQCEFNESFG